MQSDFMPVTMMPKSAAERKAAQRARQTIKTNFKDEGISTLMGLSKSLAMGFAKKKIKDITGLDIE